MYALLLIPALLIAILPVAAQTVFRCVDDQGVTHFGETMPAVCAKKPVTEMNRQGRVLRQLEPPLTPEQIKERDQLAAKVKEDAKLIDQQRMKDIALLANYGAEREFEVLRNRDLAIIDSQQKSVEKRLEEIAKRTQAYRNELEFYQAGKSKAGKGREPPPALVANLERVTNEHNNLRADLGRLDKDRSAAVARFEAEKTRWKRLKGGMAPGTVLDADGNVLIAPPARRATPPPPSR